MLSTMKHSAWPNQLYEETSKMHHHHLLDINTRPLSSKLQQNLHCLQECKIDETTYTRISASKTLQLQQLNNKSILESRRAFLENITHENLPTYTEEKINIISNVLPENTNNNSSVKKRKISFKIKNSYCNNRRQNNNNTTPTVLSANKVAQLTQKFNKLIQEEPKIARAVRRANSIRSRDTINSNSTPLNEGSTLKKPALKPKPSKFEDRKHPKKRPSIKRKTSIKKVVKQDSIKKITSNKSSNEKEIIDEIDGKIQEKNSLRSSLREELERTIFRRNYDYAQTGSVRATIEKFERRKIESNNIPKIIHLKNEQHSNEKNHFKKENTNQIKSIIPKPNIPEKNINSITKNLVIKDGVRKLKIINKSDEQIIKKSILKSTKTAVESTEKTILETKQIPKLLAETLPYTQLTCTTLETNPPISDKLNENEETILETKFLPQETTKTKNLYYERLKIPKTTISTQILKMAISEERLVVPECTEIIRPNNSFLWRSRSTFNTYATINYEDIPSSSKKSQETISVYEDTGQPQTLQENIYDIVEPPQQSTNGNEYEQKVEKILAKTDEILKDYKSPKILSLLPPTGDSKSVYESENLSNCYEGNESSNYEEVGTEYEYPNDNKLITQEPEDIYETLSIKTVPENDVSIITKPLPKLPTIEMETINSKVPQIETDDTEYEEEIYSTVKEPNCYETIYPKKTKNDPVTQTINPANRFLTKYESYESIYNQVHRRDDLSSSGSNRGSIISCDQQSNSLYGRYGPASEISSSDRSDDWVDLSDAEFEEKQEPGFVIVREKQKNKRNPGWSHKVRDQFSKCPQTVVVHKDALSDSYHYYESLHSDDDFDSFDSESDDDDFTKINQNDSGVDMGNYQLPDPPGNSNNNSQIYGLTKLAASAGKHMKRLRRNWSLTKNDITKSLSRMTKKKSSMDIDKNDMKDERPPPLPTSPQPLPQLPPKKLKPPRPPPPSLEISSPILISSTESVNNKTSEYQVPINTSPLPTETASSVINNFNNKSVNSASSNKINTMMNSMSRKKNWLKFRRAVSMGDPTNDESSNTQNVNKSTFYLSNENSDTDFGQTINSTRHMSLITTTVERPQPTAPIRRRSQNIPPRPQSPPPPAPTTETKKPLTVKKEIKENKDSQLRSTSWYAECGLFKATNPNEQTTPINKIPKSPTMNQQRSPSTCWYAEVGLYQHTGSTPSTSSAENSGSGHLIQQEKLEDCKDKRKEYQIFKNKNMNNQEEYYNMRNSLESKNGAKGEDGCYYNEEFCDTEKMKRHQSGDMQLLLKDEPLYQFYDAAVVENEYQGSSSDSEYDGYEEIGTLKPQNDQNKVSKLPENTTPALPPVRTRFSGGLLPGRTLWCEVPEVIQSEILCTLTASQKKLQEAKFEIITSEASYLNSLIVLEEHFVANLDKESLLEPEDRKSLFGNITPVRECSERLLADLESCWQSSILLSNICAVIHQHCITNFSVYIRYCANQIRSDATLRRCRGEILTPQSSNYNKNKVKFVETLKKLEASPACQALSLHSFLMLPMQRITRMPLLVDAVLKRLIVKDDEYEECQKALRALNEIVKRCNEAARHTERVAELQRISQQLEYPFHITPINLLPENSTSNVQRWLVRSGDLTQLVARGGRSSADDGSNPVPKLTFGKRFTKLSITLFLFEDMLIIARKKSDDQYVVLHHCPRSFVEVSTSTPDSVTNQSTNSNDPNSLLLFLTLLENHEGRTVELMLSCSTETDRQRWLEALRPPVAEDPGETVYESWDCPQVKAVHVYQASQPDELALARGDVVNVDKKMADGWYHGTRLRDNINGWFPGNHTVEIANPHVRARNLRQRYRLLAFTDTYLNSNK